MKLLILVPVFNEWPHLLPVLQKLREHFPHVLIIDDGSDNKSYLGLLKKGGFEYLDLPFNLEHWSAIQTGFKYALTQNFDGVITIDGDGQHPPEGALKIISGLEKGFDVVIGKDNDRDGWSRKFCRGILNRLSGLAVSDFTSGLIGIVVVVLGAFPIILDKIAIFTGVSYAPALLFIIAVSLLLIQNLYLPPGVWRIVFPNMKDSHA